MIVPFGVPQDGGTEMDRMVGVNATCVGSAKATVAFALCPAARPPEIFAMKVEPSLAPATVTAVVPVAITTVNGELTAAVPLFVNVRIELNVCVDRL